MTINEADNTPKMETKPFSSTASTPRNPAGRRGCFHGSGQALELSARAGCDICSKVWAYLDQDQRANLMAWKPKIGIYGMNNKLWTWAISSRKRGRRHPCITFRVPQKRDAFSDNYKGFHITMDLYDAESRFDILDEITYRIYA